MKFEHNELVPEAPDEELLEDMRRCAKSSNRATLTISDYDNGGNIPSSTIIKRFLSWANALKQAGLPS